ncbi:MAG: response regulator transcription factor [Pseudomonadota bacterium]
MRILTIEDDESTVNFIRKGLQEAGHTVDYAMDGKDGIFLATTEKYDAIILDRMIPYIDGMTILQTIRAQDNKTPVLILSTLGSVQDRVKGLRAGCDDYLIKPFSFDELLARLDAIVRRSRDLATDVTELVNGDLRVDLLNRKVTRAGKEIILKPREYKVLEFLLEHVDQVVTRTMMLEHIWEYNFDPMTNVVDVHVGRLRRKLEEGFNQPIIHTVKGAGYIIYGKKQKLSE